MRRKSDPAHAETDQILAGLEGKISKEYEKAEREVAEKLQKHLSDFAVKEKRKLAEVNAGNLTQAEYAQWRVGQIMIGERWEEMRATLAQDLHNANRLARSMVNGHMPEVYAINHNYGTFLAEKGSLLDTSYTLYDRQTVERLMRDNPDLLKPPGKQMKQTFGEFDAYKRGEAVKITPKKKRAFDKLIRENKDIRWQAGKIQSVTLQSILQGESIPNMCRRIAREMGEINRAATTRYARTATTAAENAGRIDSFKRAEEMGIDMKQMWIATLDDRTRHEHRVLDGQIRPVGEPFEVEGYKIAYPGDPDAEAFLVYNCRCTLGAVVAGTRLAEEGLEAMERVPGYQEASYEEWKGMHEEPGTETTVAPFESEKIKAVLGSDWEEFAGLVEGSDSRKLYDEYADQCRGGYRKVSGGGCYYNGRDAVDFCYSTDEGTSRYSVFAHECGHMFDAHMGRADHLHFREVDKINATCTFGSGRFTVLKVTPSLSDEFLGAMRKDVESLTEPLRNRSIVKEMLASTAMRNATSGVQDALDGIFGTQSKGILPWGHGESYYNRAYNKRFKGLGLEGNLKQALKELGFDASNQTKVKRLSRHYETASELWANVGSAVTCGGPELKAFERFMPETVKAYRDIVKGHK